MLSSVLNSKSGYTGKYPNYKNFYKNKRATSSTNKETRDKIEEMERKYDGQLQEVFEVLKRLLTEEEKTEETN